MKIGFDARMISHPGIGRYIGELLTSMILFSKKDEFVLFGRKNELKQFSNNNIKITEWDKPIYSLGEQMYTPYGKEKVDLLHIPHFNVPVFHKTKFVVTIHDLIYLLRPDSVPSKKAYYYAKIMIGYALKYSQKVITVSESTKEELMRIFGKKYEPKIEVVYEAASSKFGKIFDERSLDSVRIKYKLPEKFILYLGSIKPHKNVESLIKAYLLLREKGITHKLVLAGKWDKKQDSLKKYLDDGNIKYVGEIDDEDVPVLYNLAQVLVHVSLMEGFGLTSIEAMQSETPIVVSNVSAISEIVGRGANLVDPEDIGQIADTVYNVLANEKFRNQTIEYGIKRAQNFSWEKTAKETMKIYSNIME